MSQARLLSCRLLLIVAVVGLLLADTSWSQRITDDLVILYDFTEGEGNVVFDRGPSLGVAGDPIDLIFDPNELTAAPDAGQFGDRPGLISWGDSWLNINKDHPLDDGNTHGSLDAAYIWDDGPGESSKIVDMIVPTGQFTLEAWVRPESIDNRSNSGRIIWMTVEGPDDANNFSLAQQSCCDGTPAPGGVQVRISTDSPGTRTTLNSDADLFEDQDLLHIVYTHDTESEESMVYLNIDGQPFDGTPVIDDIALGLDLEGWDEDYVLALANDPYRFSRWFGGELHLIAMYDRAFDEAEVQQQFDAGPGIGPPPLAGDFNANGVLDAPDVNELSIEIAAATNDVTFDLNADNLVDNADLTIWVKSLRKTWFGDTDLDGEFTSGDLVIVLAAGKFDSDEDAGWQEGDWNGDVRFTTSDVVKALADGGFGAGPLPPAAAAAVPEPSSLLLVVMGALTAMGTLRYAADNRGRSC